MKMAMLELFTIYTLTKGKQSGRMGSRGGEI
jgi:hypothetical protein